MNAMDLVLRYIKVANEAAEHNNFKTARKAHAEAKECLEMCSEEEQKALQLQLDRLADYIDEMEANKGDWLAQWYAGSASGSALRDIQKGRQTVIEIGS